MGQFNWYKCAIILLAIFGLTSAQVEEEKQLSYIEYCVFKNTTTEVTGLYSDKHCRDPYKAVLYIDTPQKYVVLNIKAHELSPIPKQGWVHYQWGECSLKLAVKNESGNVSLYANNKDRAFKLGSKIKIERNSIAIHHFPGQFNLMPAYKVMCPPFESLVSAKFVLSIEQTMDEPANINLEFGENAIVDVFSWNKLNEPESSTTESSTTETFTITEESSSKMPETTVIPNSTVNHTTPVESSNEEVCVGHWLKCSNPLVVMGVLLGLTWIVTVVLILILIAGGCIFAKPKKSKSSKKSKLPKKDKPSKESKSSSKEKPSKKSKSSKDKSTVSGKTTANLTSFDEQVKTVQL